jgi:hypothetical protein
MNFAQQITLRLNSGAVFNQSPSSSSGDKKTYMKAYILLRSLSRKHFLTHTHWTLLIPFGNMKLSYGYCMHHAARGPHVPHMLHSCGSLHRTSGHDGFMVNVLFDLLAGCGNCIHTSFVFVVTSTRLCSLATVLHVVIFCNETTVADVNETIPGPKHYAVKMCRGVEVGNGPPFLSTFPSICAERVLKSLLPFA